MRLSVSTDSELATLRAERDAWRRRAESSLRGARSTRTPRGAASLRRRLGRLLATSLLALVVALGAALFVSRQGQAGGSPDYPGCIGKARYEHPIHGNQYQELVNALYACEVYRAG